MGVRRGIMAKSPKLVEKTVKFSLRKAQAKKVMLAGNFNAWHAQSLPLIKGKDNLWTKELKLKPGKYEYKFIVDGNWIKDPANSKSTLNSLGTENSVIEV